MNVSIIGTGAYGLALALMFKNNNCSVKMWTNFEDEKKLLEQTKKSKKLPGFLIPNDILFSNKMGETVENTQLIVIAVPARHVDSVFKELKKHIKPKQHICIATKGIEQETCLFVHDVLNKYISTNKFAVISGPSFAIDIISGAPIGLSLGTKNNETEKIIKKSLQNECIKLRTTNDIVGIEICGAIKNVIAIASGILNGLGANESTQAMFITESLHDIKGLIKALNGDQKTILSFAGFGDLLLTSTSRKSRNFTYGTLIGQNRNEEVIKKYIANNTIEGIDTLKSIYKLINTKQVDMPIIDLIYNIVFNQANPQELITFLIKK